MAKKKYIVKDSEGNEMEVTEVTEETPAENEKPASKPFTEEQETALKAMISAAIEEALHKDEAHDADDPDKEAEKALNKAVEKEEKPIVGDSKKVADAAAQGKVETTVTKVDDTAESVESVWSRRFASVK